MKREQPFTRGLSTRARNILVYSLGRAITPNTVAALDYNDLKRISNCGNVTLTEIRNRLREYKKDLKNAPPLNNRQVAANAMNQKLYRQHMQIEACVRDFRILVNSLKHYHQLAIDNTELIRQHIAAKNEAAELAMRLGAASIIDVDQMLASRGWTRVLGLGGPAYFPPNVMSDKWMADNGIAPLEKFIEQCAEGAVRRQQAVNVRREQAAEAAALREQEAAQ